VGYIRRSIGIEYRLEAYATFRRLPRLCGEAKTTAQAISKREVWSGRLLLGYLDSVDLSFLQADLGLCPISANLPQRRGAAITHLSRREGYFRLVPPGQDTLFRCRIFLKLAFMAARP
jgi:hypothetical protein